MYTAAGMKRFSFQDSVLLLQPGETGMKDETDYIKTGLTESCVVLFVCFFKHGSFASHNRVNPLPLALTTSAFVAEVLVGNFIRGQDLEGQWKSNVYHKTG